MSDTENPPTRCRRCANGILIQLDRRRDDDNEVYRCTQCGFIFSPAASALPISQES